MRKLAFFALVALALLVTARQAFAIQATLATKNISVTIIVTPSPTPVAYAPATSPTMQIARGVELLMPPASEFTSMLAYEPSALGDMVAQTTTPQGSVKVQFTVKPDPTFAYFHLTPVNTTLYAGYGNNTFTCVYQVYGSYPTAWQINDWTYGSNSSGGTAGLNGFPTFNTPTASDLSWLAETVTTSYAAFSNGGAPGQSTFTGTAGQTRNICIDLSLVVPSNINAGTYGATISYRMVHS